MLGYGYYFDPTYLLVIIGAVLSIWASSRVNSTYNKYSRVRSMTGMTGAEAARMILNYNGLSDVRVEHVSGSLTDHYDPRTKVLRLSDSTYGSGSVAAIGVAAHECGHAVQDKDGYVPLKIRGALVPVANLGFGVGAPYSDTGPDFRPELYLYTDRNLGICRGRIVSDCDAAPWSSMPPGAPCRCFRATGYSQRKRPAIAERY